MNTHITHTHTLVKDVTGYNNFAVNKSEINDFPKRYLSLIYIICF